MKKLWSIIWFDLATTIWSLLVVSTISVENNSLSTNNSTCSVQVIPILYDISLNLKNLEHQRTDNNFVISAFAKLVIILSVNVNECMEHTSPDFTLHCTHCTIFPENLEIVEMATSKSVPISTNSSCHENMEHGTNGPRTTCNIQLNERLKSTIVIRAMIPYKLNLTIDSQAYKSPHGLFVHRGLIDHSEWFREEAPFYARLFYPQIVPETTKYLPKILVRIAQKNSGESDYAYVGNTDIVQNNKIVKVSRGRVLASQATIMVLHYYVKQSFDVENPQTGAHKASNITVNVWNFNYYFEYLSPTVKFLQNSLTHFVKVFQQSRLPIDSIDFIASGWHTGDSKHVSLGLVVYNCKDLLIRGIDLDDGVTEAHLNQTLVKQWIGGLIPIVIHQTSPEWNVEDGFIQYITEKLSEATTEIIPIKAFRYNGEYVFLKSLESQFGMDIIKTALFDLFIPKLPEKTFVSLDDFYNAIQASIEHHHRTHLLPRQNGSIVTIQRISKIPTMDAYKTPLATIGFKGNNSSSIPVTLQVYPKAQSQLGTSWWIPVHLVGNNWQSSVWISSSTNATVNISAQSDFWAVAGHPEYFDYYYVTYEDQLLDNIISQLVKNPFQIPLISRHKFIINQMVLVSQYPYPSWKDLRGFMEMTKYLVNETSPEIWKLVVKYRTVGMCKTYHMELYEPYLNYFAGVVNQKLEQIGVTDDNSEHSDTIEVRKTLLDLCDKLKLPKCVEYARLKISQWMQNPLQMRQEWEDTTTKILSVAICGNGFTAKDRMQIYYLFANFLLGNNSSPGDISSKTINKNWLLDFLPRVLETTYIAKETKTKFYETIPEKLTNEGPPCVHMPVLEYWEMLLLKGLVSPASFLEFMGHAVTFTFKTEEYRLKMKQIVEKNMDKFSGDLEDKAHHLIISGCKTTSGNHSVSESAEIEPMNELQRKLLDWLVRNK